MLPKEERNTLPYESLTVNLLTDITTIDSPSDQQIWEIRDAVQQDLQRETYHVPNAIQANDAGGRAGGHALGGVDKVPDPEPCRCDEDEAEIALVGFGLVLSIPLWTGLGAAVFRAFVD